jgi:hypothetical protein
MNFQDALKSIEGADSVGGQLIVNHQGVNVLVGKNVQGLFIAEDTVEAKLILGLDPSVPVDPDAPIKPPEPKTHDLKVEDSVETEDQMTPPPPAEPKSKK